MLTAHRSHEHILLIEPYNGGRATAFFAWCCLVEQYVLNQPQIARWAYRVFRAQITALYEMCQNEHFFGRNEDAQTTTSQKCSDKHAKKGMLVTLAFNGS